MNGEERCEWQEEERWDKGVVVVALSCFATGVLVCLVEAVAEILV